MLLFSFIGLFFRLGREILAQEWLIRTHFLPLLAAYLRDTDGSFTRADVRRMCYYIRMAPSLSGANYATLMNRRMTAAERLQMSRLSAAAPMFDDYFDRQDLSEAQLHEMIAHPEKHRPANTREAVFIHFIRTIKADIADFEAFYRVCTQLFDAQMRAKQQETGGLSRQVVHQLTFDKGGYSTLLFGCLMQHDLPDHAIYTFGGMVQWVDDVFDVYEDTQAGIQTLATPCPDISELWRAFDHELIETLRLFWLLDLPKRQIRRFLDVQLFFFTRTAVCFEQFAALQRQNQGIFSPERYPRKALICDMEKWENILKWWRYFRHYRHTLFEALERSAGEASAR